MTFIISQNNNTCSKENLCEVEGPGMKEVGRKREGWSRGPDGPWRKWEGGLA